MVLNLNTITSNNNSWDSQLKTKSKAGISMAGSCPQQKPDSFDKSCDGKFSASEAAKNFWQGLISPVTSMFSSPKSFLTSAGMIAGSAAIIALTGGAAAPIFVAAGVAMGAFQVGETAIKLYNAKDGDDLEKAFYDFGSATSTIGLSAIGAKSSLNQASIESKNLRTLEAVRKCFTTLKEQTIECFDVFKSGYYKTNWSNAVKVAKQPKSLIKYAQELHDDGERNFAASFNALRDILPEEFKSSLTGRNKSQISIYEKMVKERTTYIDNEIKNIKNNPELSNAEKNAEIQANLELRRQIAYDPEYAKSLIGDRYGARLTLDDVSEASMNKLVNSLVKAARRGDIEIIEIENYKGCNSKYSDGSQYYFTQEQMNALKNANKKVKTKIMNKNKASGYSAVQLQVKTKYGNILELQISGDKMRSFADVEHFPYDLRQNKDIAKGNNKIGILSAKVKNAIQNLSEEQYKIYQKYIYDNYIYAQAKEFGKVNEISVKLNAEGEVELPKGIDEVLSAKSLHELHDQTSKYAPSAIKSPYIIKPQASFVAGVNYQIEDQG